MTAAIPTRMLVLLGAAIAAVAALLVLRPLVLSGSEESSTPAPAATSPKPAAPATTPAPSTRLQLVDGLPAPVARELRYEKVVVVSLVGAPAALDRKALAQAEDGAKAVDAGFVAVNLLDEKVARGAADFVGTSSTPAVLVVKRPGTIVARFDGFVDSAVVAQAAQNAGAGK